MWDVNGQEETVAGITWKIPAYLKYPVSDTETIGLLRIQDMMVANIIQWVNWSRPIYFAVTVARENKIGLEDYLSMEGMVYRLEQTKAKPGDMLVNVPVMRTNVFEKYQYRSLDDPTIYKPPNTLKLVTNYFIGFAQLCENYARTGDSENAVRAAWGAIERTPNDFNKRFLLYQVLLASKMNDEIKEFLDRESLRPEFYDDRTITRENRMKIMALYEVIGEEDKTDTLYQAELEHSKEKLIDFQSRLEFGTQLLQRGLNRHAHDFFLELVEENPNNVEAWKAYAAVLFSIGEYDKALAVTDKIVELAPDDQVAQETRDFLINEVRKKTTPDSTRLNIPPIKDN
ncbi:tetratricopeptide repeat protein [Candidatus Latescibacterota bacterium]